MKVIYMTFLVLIPILSDAANGEDRFSGLPIPRYVATAAKETNARYGPGLSYPLKWTYTKKNFPLKVIDEYYNWRKVIDFTGISSWVHQSVLSGKNHALILINEKYTNLYNRPAEAKKTIAKIEKYSIVEVANCENKYCKVNIKGYQGYIKEKDLWGSKGE
jgi:SH3-like domain-containing protein